MKSSVLWLAATNCCLSAALRMDGQQNLDDQHNDHAIMHMMIFEPGEQVQIKKHTKAQVCEMTFNGGKERYKLPRLRGEDVSQKNWTSIFAKTKDDSDSDDDDDLFPFESEKRNLIIDEITARKSCWGSLNRDCLL